MNKILFALLIVCSLFLAGCPIGDVNICSGNTINNQVEPPNDENNVICGVTAE